MKPGATLRSPSDQGRVPRRNSFATLPRPNTVSSFSSDLTVNPRKLFASARHQTADVCLFERQTGGDFAVRESLLFKQQATSHRLFYFVQSAASLFDRHTAFVVIFRRIDEKAVFCGGLVILVVANHRAALTPQGISRHVKSHAQKPRPQ